MQWGGLETGCRRLDGFTTHRRLIIKINKRMTIQIADELTERRKNFAVTEGIPYLARAFFTISMKSRAFCVIWSNWRDVIIALLANSPPTPMAHAPAWMNWGAVSLFTEPVGINSMWGNGPFRSLKNLGPPTPAGKIFTTSAPSSQAWSTSV